MDARHIADRLEIQDVLVRYCNAIDTGNYAMLDEVFTPDGIADYTAAGGIRGTLAEIKEWLDKALAPFPVRQHLVTNFQIEIDGDRASTHCYLFNPLGFPQGGSLEMLFCGGGYRDTFVRTGTGWRIAERVISTAYLHGKLPG
ncbi:MAG TPA: nuclear transport factor 2 family protein [Candidatus Limnocylindrales bacterium]|nr:nuclear transport factor 2 family protein [Candidatus Limnocylindrales bacterium]